MPSGRGSLPRMQLRAYSRAPYVVLYYRPTFQAFRTDRFEAPADESIAIVFAAPPQNSINLQLRPTAAPPPPEAPEDDRAEAAPPDDLVDEIQSSRLWQLLALAGVLVLALLLLPRVVRGVVWLVRRRKRARTGDGPDEESGADTHAGRENDGGRP